MPNPNENSFSQRVSYCVINGENYSAELITHSSTHTHTSTRAHVRRESCRTGSWYLELCLLGAVIAPRQMLFCVGAESKWCFVWNVNINSGGEAARSSELESAGFDPLPTSSFLRRYQQER